MYDVYESRCMHVYCQYVATDEEYNHGISHEHQACLPLVMLSIEDNTAGYLGVDI